jgi:hypothetical protein
MTPAEPIKKTLTALAPALPYPKVANRQLIAVYGRERKVFVLF